MTTNQIAYLKAMNDYDLGYRNWLENRRHNTASEFVTSYQATEAKRHNLADERNRTWATKVESLKNKEARRHNKAQEQLDQYGKNIQREYNLGTIANAARANELRGFELNKSWTELLYNNEFRRIAAQQNEEAMLNQWNIANLTSSRNLAAANIAAAATRSAAATNAAASRYVADKNESIAEKQIQANTDLQESKYGYETDLQILKNEGNQDVAKTQNKGKYWTAAIQGGFGLLNKAIDIAIPYVLNGGGGSNPIGFGSH